MVRLPKRRSEAFENFSLYFAIFVPLNRSQCKSYCITATPYLLPVLLRKLKGNKRKNVPTRATLNPEIIEVANSLHAVGHVVA